MTVRTRAITIWALLLLGLVLTARAQVKVGDNLSMNLNGQASAGYTADYGNFIQADHGFTFGGNVNLSGSYYSPGFLSFTINPFYNQSRENSTSQSIFDSTGVNASANIFSGSKFPGTISYSKLYTNSGEFSIPGLPSYTTSGSSDALGIGWAARIPDLPSLTVNYQQGGSDYSIYGQNGTSTNSFHSLFLSSAYQWEGFNFNGGYTHTQTHSEFPSILAVGVPEVTDASGNSFSASVGHQLPMSGAFSAAYTHSTFDSTYLVSASTPTNGLAGSVNTVSGNLFFVPAKNLTTGVSANYTDNLLGSLYLPIVGSGSTAQPIVPAQSTNSLNLTEYATYLVSPHVTVNGFAQQVTQNYSTFGTISADSATATISYTNTLWGGNAALLGGVNANTTSSVGSGVSIGAIASATYSHDFGNWGAAGSINYQQNTQTAVAGYTTSSFGYSGNFARRLGRWHLSGMANGGKTLLNHTGYSSFTQTYGMAFSGRWWGVNGSYTNSSGNAIIAGNGLVPTPIPPIILPSDIIFYGGTGWGAGLGLTPFRHFTANVTFTDSHSKTASVGSFSYNSNQVFVATTQYQFRQLYLNGGYTRLLQGFSASGLPPTMQGSWYVGIQRWFNFF